MLQVLGQHGTDHAGPFCSGADIHHGNVRRRFGAIERRAARRIFFTRFGTVTLVRSAAFFPRRRAFLSSLGASIKKRIPNVHFRIRIAQPVITALPRFPGLRRSFAGQAGAADSSHAEHGFPPSAR